MYGGCKSTYLVLGEYCRRVGRAGEAVIVRREGPEPEQKPA